MKTMFEKEADGHSTDMIDLCKWELWVQIPGQMAGNVVGVILELPKDMAEAEDECDQKDPFYSPLYKSEVSMSARNETLMMKFQVTNYLLRPEDTFYVAGRVREAAEHSFSDHEHSPIFLYTKEKMPIGGYLKELPDRGWEQAEAVFSLKQRMARLTFTYRIEEKTRWYPLIKYIVSSMREA